MRLVRAAFLAVGSAILGGCLATGAPTVGTISECAPGLDPVACRTIAQTAFAAYEGPALVGDRVQVDVWASCNLDGVRAFAEAAVGATTCYHVTVLVANSGGQRIADEAYRGGTLVSVESVVWVDAEGRMHAVTRAIR